MQNKRKGWIKLHRSIMDWEHYGEPSVAMVYITLLLNAGWADDNSGVSSLSLNELEQLTKLSRNTIKNALRKLVESGEILRIKNKNNTTTKIVNFGSYQSKQRGSKIDPVETQRESKIDPPKTPRGSKIDPHTPLYINKEEYKESEKNAHARANAKVLNDFLNGGISLEAFCKNNRIAPDECRRLAEAIVNEWDISGRQHRDESDAKEHLMTLIRNRHKEQSNGDDSNNDEPHRPNPLDRARVITVRV